MDGEIITALTLPDEEQFKHDMQAINRFQQIVHSTMIVDLDYGIIPGTQKPTLLKPGAEKIAKLLGLSDQYEILDKVEDWTNPLFRYLIKCRLVHLATNAVISEGLGECNSMESKYRWRDSKRKCPECGAEAIIKGKEQYGGGWICFGKIGGCGEKWPDGAPEIEGQKIGRVENEDIYSQVNTILKMAKKRALVDAALSAGRLSDIFTQDMEDIGHTEIKEQLGQDSTQGLKKGSGAQETKIDNPTQLESSAKAETHPIGKKVQNIAEFKGLLGKHKVGTREAYEILSINSFMELVDLDEAWAKIKEAKGLEP